MMALKGGRKIVVRDLAFRWKFKPDSTPRYLGDSPCHAHVAVQEDVERPGRPMVARLRTRESYNYDGMVDNKFTVAPSDVRQLIEHCLDLGWEPSARKQFNCPEGVELADYQTYERKRGSLG